MFKGFPRVTVKHEIDEVIEYIKNSNFFDYYKEKVLEQETCTNNFLNRRTILEVQNDPQTMLLISAAANDMLFSMIDQKLRNEICRKGMNMCDYCLMIGGKHDCRCPNAPEPKTLLSCDICHKDNIYEGDTYWNIDGLIICESCMDKSKKVAEVE